MKRAIVCVHYDRDGLIDPYVLHLLESLRPHADRLVFVSAAAREDQLDRVRSICDVAFSRENVGYDFMSWKSGLAHIGNIDAYDEITFVNDSIYGPLFDIGPLFKQAESIDCQFWGLVTNNEVTPHIQSFFFTFRRQMVADGAFTRFWDGVEILDDKQEIIRRYEIGMTEFVRSAGYRIFSFFDQRKLSLAQRLMALPLNGTILRKSRAMTLKFFIKNSRAYNPTHVYWRTLLEFGVPFIKIELLRTNPLNIRHDLVRAYLSRLKSYDAGLIDRHLQRLSHPASKPGGS